MNIYDIAERCGVSIATVSRVLNDSPHVRPQTREKILAVMQEEGYSPNAFARGLGAGSTGMVGLLCTDLCDPFYAEAISYLETRLQENGLAVLLRCCNTTPDGMRCALEDLSKHQVSAILLVGAVDTQLNSATLSAIAQKTPLILVNSHLDAPGIYSVTADEREAIRSVIGQLMLRQRKRILFLYDRMTDSTREKLAGYEAGYAAASLSMDPQLTVRVASNLEDINTCIKQLLVRRVSFDAVIGAEDLFALGTQKALQRIGLSMPLIGFNNSLLARCATPTLSSIDNNIQALCDAATELLADLLQQKQPAATHLCLPATLVERDTFRFN